MITLHQFHPAFGLPNPSPFCMKVETYLRMAGLPYRCDNRASPLSAPKGKLPWIDDDGAVVADSSFIVEHLRARHGDALDAWLTPAQRATALAFQRLFEEHLYWAVVHARWIAPAGWALTRQAFFGRLKPPQSWLIPSVARKRVRAKLVAQGLGRHSDAEIVALACRDLDAVAAQLDAHAFMLGDQPSSLDATAYAFLANLLWAPYEMPMRRHAQSLPVLEAYCRRMKARYYDARDGDAATAGEPAA